MPFEEGIQAKYKYQPVKYFPFNAEPGASYVLTSDPWSYLKAWLEQQAKKTRGDNKARFTKAKYFVEQAESFEQAASKTRLPTKATLVYYSLLNLSKAFLSTNGLDLEQKEEIHGISLTECSSELKIKGHTTKCVNVFYEFSRALGHRYTGEQKVRIEDIYSEIPEIHELAYSLGLVSKRKFLRVNIEFLTNHNKNKLFTEVSFKKEHEARVPIDKFYKENRSKYFKTKEGLLNDEYIVYRSAKRKSFNKANFCRIYKNVCNEFSRFDIALILTREGYLYYVNLSSNGFHQLANVLLTTFYMGTVARYKPTVTQQIMSGDQYPVMAEIINTSPRQFLYYLSSLMTNSVCAVPMAKIYH